MMEREIKFRGKSCEYDNINQWVYGYYAPLFLQETNGKDDTVWGIVSDKYIGNPSWFGGMGSAGTPHAWKVAPHTVGQYTGLKDKNGVEIYEGDIVKGLFYHAEPVLSICSFKDGAFGIKWKRGEVWEFYAFTSICNVEYDVVGNTYDNPELMEV